MQHTAESREPRGVEEVGCKLSSGALTVSQTRGYETGEGKISSGAPTVSQTRG